jgi:signal transduction histidine kinase
MSQEAKRDASDLHFLLQFINESSTTESVEQVYAGALTAVQEILGPDRAFVALSESGNGGPEKRFLHPVWLSDLSVPIYAGKQLMGRIMIQYDTPHPFSAYDLGMLEMIATHAGVFIEHLQERENARDAQRKKHEVVAMAAHELRAPLTAILGAIHVLRRGRDNEGFQALDIIERNARVQVTLIEELLQVSQLDAGKVELKIVELDLVTILARVIGDIQPAAAANNTTIKTFFPGPVFARGDARRLWQIFWNLLANSIRFCPNGHLQIIANSDSGGAKISIQDDGVGITRDQLPHIFERFRQGHIPRMNSEGGLGLGLAIVKDLVTLHGGTIAAESDGPGKGACFTVILPS